MNQERITVTETSAIKVNKGEGSTYSYYYKIHLNHNVYYNWSCLLYYKVHALFRLGKLEKSVKATCTHVLKFRIDTTVSRSNQHALQIGAYTFCIECDSVLSGECGQTKRYCKSLVSSMYSWHSLVNGAKFSSHDSGSHF